MEKKKLIHIFEYGIILVLLTTCIILAFVAKKSTTEKKEEDILEQAKLVLYEGPTSLKDATEEDLTTIGETRRNFQLLHCTDMLITVNGYDCYVYDTNVNHTRKWYSDYMPPNSRTPITYFDFEGGAKIKVTVPNIDISSVKISPVNYGIEPEINKEKHTISFYITQPDTYTVTFNDSPNRAVHLFANPIETDIPSKEDENVIFIGPGEWDIENIILEDNQTLYISGGAVIHGIVNANFAKNVTVRGRGIIDGSKFEGWMGKVAYIPLKFDHCESVVLKDVLVLNSNAWVCQAFDSKNGIIDGLKIISSRPNGDGITLQSCENYKVSNGFVRSWDDSLVVKNYDGNSKSIHFSNIQLWTDFAQSMEIGYETNKGNKENARMEDIKFENITVLNNFHKPVVSVHNADDAIISNVLFRDIVIENAQMGSGDSEEMPYLIDVNIAQSSNWSTTKERGQIMDVVIDGVTVLSGRFNESRIHGFDKDHIAENIHIKDLTILGQKIETFKEGKFDIDEASTKNLVIE